MNELAALPGRNSQAGWVVETCGLVEQQQKQEQFLRWARATALGLLIG